MRRVLGVSVVSVGVLFAVAGCPGSFQVCDEVQCGSTGDGGGSSSGSSGGDGGDGGVIAPPGCDLTKSVKDSPACVDEAVGLFVSANGSDEGAGTKGSPLKSIGKALEKQGNKPRVYVCEGTYEERVEVKGGVTVLGGFGCADWKYTGTKSKLAPKEAGYAVVLTKVSQPVTVEDFEIKIGRAHV